MDEKKCATIPYRHNKGTETFTIESSPAGMEMLKALVTEGAKHLFPDTTVIFEELKNA